MGTLLVVFILFLKEWLGTWGTISAMILTTLSSTNLYFSRDNIHEIYFMVFTLLGFVCGYLFFRTGRNKYIYLTMINLALMFTLKETAIITTGIWALSLIVTGIADTLLNKKQKFKESIDVLIKNVKAKFFKTIPIIGLIFIIVTLVLMFGFSEKFNPNVKLSFDDIKIILSKK